MADKKYASITAITQLWAKIKALIPTKVSDLTNDSGFQTASDVSTAVSEKVSKSGDTMTGQLVVPSNQSYPYNGGIKFQNYGYPEIRVAASGGYYDSSYGDSYSRLSFYQGTSRSVLLGNITSPKENSDAANKQYVDGLWTSTKITNTLGYTPYNGATNPNGYLTLSDLPLYDGSYTQTTEGGSY